MGIENTKSLHDNTNLRRNKTFLMYKGSNFRLLTINIQHNIQKVFIYYTVGGKRKIF